MLQLLRLSFFASRTSADAHQITNAAALGVKDLVLIGNNERDNPESLNHA
jgi:hypothetical protein